MNLLSPRIGPARKAYETFVADGTEEGRRSEFHFGSHEGRILGDDTFVDDVLFRTCQKGEREYSLAEVVGEVCAHFGISEEQLKAPGKVRRIRRRGLSPPPLSGSHPIFG